MKIEDIKVGGRYVVNMKEADSEREALIIVTMTRIDVQQSCQLIGNMEMILKNNKYFHESAHTALAGGVYRLLIHLSEVIGETEEPMDILKDMVK